MKPLFSFLTLSLFLAAPLAAHADGVNATQLDALTFLAKNIQSCPVYSINKDILGNAQNHPYDEGCVDRLVDSAAVLYAAFLPDHANLVREVKSIENCPVYSLNPDILNNAQNHPFEETCVNNIVTNLVADLADLAPKQ